MTIITLPHRPARNHRQAEPLFGAALEWEQTNDQLELLTAQIKTLAARRSALAGAAAACLVLREHPTASVLIFAVKDGRTRILARVLDSQGRILPARRTGEWAEEVLSTVINEDLSLFGHIEGVEVNSDSVRIDIDQVAAAASIHSVRHWAPVSQPTSMAA